MNKDKLSEFDHDLGDENRYMKSMDQVRILENEFAKEQKWSKDKMKKLAHFLNLKES